jgi:hypothetical protein
VFYNTSGDLLRSYWLGSRRLKEIEIRFLTLRLLIIKKISMYFKEFAQSIIPSSLIAGGIIGIYVVNNYLGNMVFEDNHPLLHSMLQFYFFSIACLPTFILAPLSIFAFFMTMIAGLPFGLIFGLIKIIILSQDSEIKMN